ncbi:MAG: type II toxin-antitoxin system HicA family toxin [bacterium]|nr:type II toxin-antitoxin system HicA family toxin [bacterium]
MPRLSPVSSRKLIKIVTKLGFKKVRQEGSHARFIHPDGRKTTIPMHSGENIHRGLLRKILKDIEIQPEKFNDLR